MCINYRTISEFMNSTLNDNNLVKLGMLYARYDINDDFIKINAVDIRSGKVKSRLFDENEWREIVRSREYIIKKSGIDERFVNDYNIQYVSTLLNHIETTINQYLSNNQNNISDISKHFISGIFASVGSIDYHHNFMTMDLDLNKNPAILQRKYQFLTRLISYVCDSNAINYNSRTNQPNSDMKNDQFRINLDLFEKYFYFVFPEKQEQLCRLKRGL